MKRFFRHFRFAVFGVALLCIALGITMLLWPHEVTKVLCYGFGGVLALSGLLQIASYLTGDRGSFSRKLLLLSGILSAVVGVWVLFSPDKVMTLTVIVMGIVLLYHGAMDVKYAFDIKACGAKGWILAMLFGLATCGVGVLVLVNPFEAASALLLCAGIGFLFDGLTDLFTVFSVAHAESSFEKLAAAGPVIELEPSKAEEVAISAPSENEENEEKEKAD